MGLTNIVRTRGFRNFMAKLYGLGASVVILGALFKINHYAGADIMLIVGLGTESLIFFFSAFEPPHVDPDWSLVYPELAGMYRADGPIKKPTEELDDLLADAKIGPELIASLGTGLRKMSDNASKLADITDAASVTNEYVSNVKNASVSVSELTDSYKNTSQALQQDADSSEQYLKSIKSAAEGANSLSDSYTKAAESLVREMEVTNDFTEGIKAATHSANELSEKYSLSANALAESAKALDLTSSDSAAYTDELKRISTNLSALNAAYELQLQATNQQSESAAKIQQTFESFMENLGASSEKTLAYKQELDTLTDRVAALNKVYGNMLNAMGSKPDA
ncbi:MAG: gliding motility protein GldL [Bacteroidetes bacterium]|nr:gliding motility protein GldL [Bacteroidota bacterium]